MPDYSTTPLWRKLGIKPDAVVAFDAAPPQLRRELDDVPDGVRRARGSSACDVILVFVLTQDTLRGAIKRWTPRLLPNGGLWIAWPKRSSPIETEIDFNSVQRAVWRPA